MKTFLQALASAALLGAVVLGVVGILILHHDGYEIRGFGGLAVLISGGAALILYLVGLALSASLRSRGAPLFWRIYRWSIPLFVVLCCVGLGVNWTRERLESRRSRQAHESTTETVLIPDPVRLQAYVAEHGLDTIVPSAENLTPLEAAITGRHRSLIETFLAQGARVTDRALVKAVEQGDAGLLDLLLDHAVLFDGPTLLAAELYRPAAIAALNSNRLPTGQPALDEAFARGRLDLLKSLAQAGVETNSAATRLIRIDEYLRFLPGEVGQWHAFLALWPSSSPTIQRAVNAAAREDGSPVPLASFGEKEVLNVLNLLLVSDSLYEDPVVDFKNMAIPDWMKTVPRHGANHPRINRAILESMYPGLLAPFPAAKGLALLTFLSTVALDKEGEGGALILRAAVLKRNVEVADMLLSEGFRLKSLEGEFPFFDIPEDRRMKAYLEAHGMTPSPSKH